MVARTFIATVLATCSLGFAAQAQEASGANQDFVDYASRHCAAMIQQGNADLTFMLGTSAAKFFYEDVDAFNRAMASRIVSDYKLDASKGCVFDMVTVGQRKFTSNKPVKFTGRLPQPEPVQDVAVAGGTVPSTSDVPVSMVYRFERLDRDAWVITNISINGQPMGDRFRDKLDEIVAHNGVDEALEKINTIH